MTSASPAQATRAVLEARDRKQGRFEKAWQVSLMSSAVLREGSASVVLQNGGWFVAEATVLGIVLGRGDFVWTWAMLERDWRDTIPPEVMRYADPQRAAALKAACDDWHRRKLVPGSMLIGPPVAKWNSSTTMADYVEAQCLKCLHGDGVLRVEERVAAERFVISCILRNPTWVPL